MSYQSLPIDVLLERVAEMPDIEAEQELMLRKEDFALEIAILQQELSKIKSKTGLKTNKAAMEIGYALQVMAQDNARLNSALHLLRERITRRKWSKAVMEVCGPELFEQCRIWMETQE